MPIGASDCGCNSYLAGKNRRLVSLSSRCKVVGLRGNAPRFTS